MIKVFFFLVIFGLIDASEKVIWSFFTQYPSVTQLSFKYLSGAS